MRSTAEPTPSFLGPDEHLSVSPPPVDNGPGNVEGARVVEPSYREHAPTVHLPLAGARVFALQREGGGANVAMMATWMGSGLLAGGVGMLAEGHVSDEVLPMLALPIVALGMIASWVVYRRVGASGGYRLHVAGARRILERLRPPAAFDLDHARVRATRYEYAFRGGRGAMPTVVLELPDGSRLVISGPIGVGWQNLAEEDDVQPRPPTSPAPQARLDDAATFQALRAAGT